jgi:hypothetical protein
VARCCARSSSLENAARRARQARVHCIWLRFGWPRCSGTRARGSGSRHRAAFSRCTGGMVGHCRRRMRRHRGARRGRRRLCLRHARRLVHFGARGRWHAMHLGACGARFTSGRRDGRAPHFGRRRGGRWGGTTCAARPGGSRRPAPFSPDRCDAAAQRPARLLRASAVPASAVAAPPPIAWPASPAEAPGAPWSTVRPLECVRARAGPRAMRPPAAVAPPRARAAGGMPGRSAALLPAPGIPMPRAMPGGGTCGRKAWLLRSLRICGSTCATTGATGRRGCNAVDGTALNPPGATLVGIADRGGGDRARRVLRQQVELRVVDRLPVVRPARIVRVVRLARRQRAPSPPAADRDARAAGGRPRPPAPARTPVAPRSGRAPSTSGR